MMESVPATANAMSETVLQEWRRQAADALLAVSAAVFLPPVALFLTGYGPPLSGTTKLLALAIYLFLVACALLRRVDYRARLRIALCNGYLAAILGNIAVQNGPFSLVMCVGLPLLALVLLGVRAGRLAALTSVVVFLFVPFLHDAPGLVQSLMAGPVQASTPLGVRLTQGMVLTAVLVALMILLERFHLFLMQALAAECRASARLEREAAERTRAHQDLQREMQERRRLERELTRIGDDERRRLGQEVHDGVCQELTGALLRCQGLERRLEQGGTLAMDDIGALTTLMKEAIDDAHAVSKGLCPLEPGPHALALALRSLTMRTQKMAGVRCEFLATGDVHVPDPTTAHHLYRIAQEALSNAARHAQASRIVVELRGCEGELRLLVQDDGAGLPRDLPEGRMGLRTMTLRAKMLEGEINIAPAPEGGTCVVCRVPREISSHPERTPYPEILDTIHGVRDGTGTYR